MHNDDLKHLLQTAEVPPPSEGAKKAALEAAQRAFAAHQEKVEKKSKGFAQADRPTFSPMMAWEQLKGRLTMQRAYVFTGSMAAIAVMLAVTTTHYSTIMAPVMPKEMAVEEAVVMPEREADKEADKKENGKDSAAMDMVARPSLRKEKAAMEESTQQAAPVPPPPPVQAAASAAAPEVFAAAPMAMPQKSEAKRARNAPMMALAKEATGDDALGASANVAPRSDMAVMNKKMGRVAQSAQESMAYYQPVPVVQSGDHFESFAENPVKLAKDEPVSTFSLDVDTASYSFVRRMINGGGLPPVDAVRVEEMVNYFDYGYSLPESKEKPFKPTVTVYPTPWSKDTKLVHIGIKGYEMKADKPRSNLVFLVDVSGSMNGPDRLPLVKTALRMLLDTLEPEDTVGIVTYAGNAGTVLEPTKVARKAEIAEAIERLGAGGSTAGSEGIRQAYALAERNFNKDAVNRVILSTDGDFNVGITEPKQLQHFIERKRDSGIFLSILGVGQGNLNDGLMQRLAQNGNGTAAYIDTLNEARKLLVEEAGATLFTIAKDVKIQVEFNPEMVSEYRLIGYESRLLKREDFNNDKVDAGDVGSGHAVTAIYEITPAGAKSQVDGLRYGKGPAPVEKKGGEHGGEYAFLKIRYKLPDEQESKLLTTPINASQEVKDIAQASDDVRFSTAVAGFGQLLKGDTHMGGYSYDDVVSLGAQARGKDAFGYRAEFLNLVRLAKSESGMQRPVPGSMQGE